MVKKIALEEHFLCPALQDYWNPTAADLPPGHPRAGADAACTDFGERGLAAWTVPASSARSLALAGPGVQIERDTATAIRNAREANDFLAREIQKRPDRYSGFAHLPMQDAKAAADELERCVRELKFCGAMINGHTNGQYLDHPVALPVLGARRSAGRADLSASGRSGGAGAGARGPQGTAPRHLGMDVRDRLARAAAHLRRRVRPLPARQARPRPSGRDVAVPALAASTAAPAPTSTRSSSRKRPSQYIKDNIIVTTSGMCSAEPLTCTIAALGHEQRDVRRRLSLRVGGGSRAFHRRRRDRRRGARDICFNNAVRLLRLPT